MSEFDEEAYDDLIEEKEDVEEDNDEYSAQEQGFLKGYEEELEDPYEERVAEEEKLSY